MIGPLQALLRPRRRARVAVDEWACLTGELLKRVDNGNWQTPQTGVEYYHWDQQGGVYGDLYVQFWAGTGVSGSVELMSSGVEQVSSCGGWLYNDATDNTIQLGTYKGSYSYGYPKVEDGALTLVRGSSFATVADSYSIWVAYSKEAI